MAQVSQDFIISEESKDVLLSKIQDLEFTESRLVLQAYRCGKCGNVAIRHRITNCHHVFCHGCYGQVYKRPCPVCDAIITEGKQDEEFQKTVFKLKVGCEFREQGCQAVVHLWNFLGHIGICRFATEHESIPRVYRFDPKAEALQQENDKLQELKDLIQDMQAEMKLLRDSNQTMVESMKKHDEDMVEMKATNEESVTVTKEMQTMLGHFETQNRQQFEDQNKAINDLQQETSAAIKEHTTMVTKEFADVKSEVKRQEQEIVDVKKAIDELAAQIIPVVHQEIQNQFVQLSEDYMNQSEVLKEVIKKQEEETAEIKKAIDGLCTNQQEACVATKEQIIKVAKELISLSAQFADMKTEVKKQVDGLAVQIPLVRKEIQNQFGNQFEIFGYTMKSSLNEVKQEILGVEIQNQFRNQFEKFSEVLKSSLNDMKQDILAERQVLTANTTSEDNKPKDSKETQTEHCDGELKESTEGCLEDSYRRETLPTEPGNRGDWLETTFNWTITGVEEKLKSCKKTGDIFAESEEYTIRADGLKFIAKILHWDGGSRGRHMLIQLYFTSNPLADSRPFLHSRKYVLLDQSNSGGKQDVVLLDQPRFGETSTANMTREGFWYNIFFPISLLQDSDKYVKHDKIFVRLILEPLASMFKRVSSKDGVLLWRIDNYSRRKQEAVQTFGCYTLTSESFYTSAKGYRVDAECDLNGWPNEGKWITLYPVFRIGEWDDLHPGPHRYKCRRFLMDQSDEPMKRHIMHETGVREISITGPWTQFPDFISHEEAEQPPYLKDDTLLFKIVIETY